MIFKDVVEKSNFDDVYSCLLDNYEKVKNANKDKIRKGYEDIESLPFEENKDEFTIVIGVSENEGYTSYDVSGLKSNEDMLYSLVFTEWEEWLGFDVDKELIDTMSFSEITAHCFWEMTWHGWTKEERAYNIEIENKEDQIGKGLEKLADDFKNHNRTITDEILDEIIDKYEKAETNSLQVSIEIIIEELIESRLVTEKQVKKIKDKFDAEDISKAIEGLL